KLGLGRVRLLAGRLGQAFHGQVETALRGIYLAEEEAQVGQRRPDPLGPLGISFGVLEEGGPQTSVGDAREGRRIRGGGGLPEERPRLRHPALAQELLGARERRRRVVLGNQGRCQPEDEGRGCAGPVPLHRRDTKPFFSSIVTVWSAGTFSIRSIAPLGQWTSRAETERDPPRPKCARWSLSER